jgi:predicted RNA-binding protein with PIN domain
VKIIYSRIGDKADTVIKRILSSHRREWIVITSDRDIADHAWSAGSIPVTSEAFLSVFQRHVWSVHDEEEDRDDYPGDRRKGNPRQLSRKDKAVRRALQKL